MGTLPARQLIDAISPLYRDAGLEAYRNKRDKSARLKKEFYSEVMDILGGEISSEVPACGGSISLLTVANQRLPGRRPRNGGRETKLLGARLRSKRSLAAMLLLRPSRKLMSKQRPGHENV